MDISSTEEYSLPISNRLYPYMSVSTHTIVIFEHSNLAQLITVTPYYTILGLFECLGGFTILIVFLAKMCVKGFERRMLEADLIKYFFQIERKTKSRFEDNVEREKPNLNLAKVNEVDISAK